MIQRHGMLSLIAMPWCIIKLILNDVVSMQQSEQCLNNYYNYTHA